MKKTNAEWSAIAAAKNAEFLRSNPSPKPLAIPRQIKRGNNGDWHLVDICKSNANYALSVCGRMGAVLTHKNVWRDDGIHYVDCPHCINVSK